MKVMEEQKDYKERIFSFIFDAQEDIRWTLQQDKITNYFQKSQQPWNQEQK